MATSSASHVLFDIEEQIVAMSGALELLKPWQRALVRMVYLEHISVAEVAAGTTRSQGAVRKLVARSLEALRLLLRRGLPSEFRQTTVPV